MVFLQHLLLIIFILSKARWIITVVFIIQILFKLFLLDVLLREEISERIS